MSVKTSPSEDTSTNNANWGTLVIVLLVVIIAWVIAAVAYNSGKTPTATPVVINAQSATTPVPGPQGAPGAVGVSGSPGPAGTAGPSGSNSPASGTATGTSAGGSGAPAGGSGGQ